MGRRATLTNALTKGVIDPALSERIDLDHYYNGLESGLNIECSPQGGFGRRAGTTLAKPGVAPLRLRHRIQPLQVTSGMVTAANGGTIANLLDQNYSTQFTTSSLTGSTFVVCQIDLGSPKEIVFFDVIGFLCGSGRYPRAFGVEYWNGAAWVGFGPTTDTMRKTITTSLRTRRFGERPGVTRTAQTWRIVVYNGSGAGAIGIRGIRLWQEKRQLSPARGRSFARTADLVYEHVLTDRNIDVFRDHEYLASIPVDIDAANVTSMERVQELDTAIFFHEDIQPPEIQRQGANDEWNSVPITFTNVPNLTSGTAFSGDQDEVQKIELPGLMDGQSFVLWLGASCTAPIVFASSFSGDVRTALIALGVPTGLTVSVSFGATPTATLTFSGNAGSRRWPVVRAVVLDSDSIEPSTTVLQRGLASSGPIMGDTTGWPRCAALEQERLLVSGFRAAPLTYGLSRFGQLYNFLDVATPLTADLAIFGTLNAAQLETIRQVFVGRHLLFFTESSTWFAERRTIDATQPFNVTYAARVPIATGLPIHFIEGSAVFVQDGGRILRDMVYSDVELSYTPEPLSLLAPHLMTGAVDAGYRQQRTTSEGNQLFLVNADGSICFMSVLKAQKVVAAAPWTTDGKFRSAFGDTSARLWLIVERETPANGTDLYLEKLDGTHTLDAAVVYDAGGAATSTITGLGHLEGKTVWGWIDRELVGPMVVKDGQVTLDKPATLAIVGLFPPLRARLPRLREKLQNGYPWRPPARINEIGLSLAGTGQVDVAVNGGPFRQVKLTDDGTRALDIAAEAPRDTTGIASSSAADSLERLLQAVVMIPGSGEFAYGTTPVNKTTTGFASISENAHTDAAQTDFSLSFGQARRAMPSLARVALPVSWFGSDLRAGSCEIKPKVATAASGSLSWSPYDWNVSGLSRSTATRVSLSGGRPAFGGTPTDASVIEAIQAMKAAGIEVTLVPFLMMDIASGNTLDNPYGGTGQPVYPWRGRITCHPAPGVSGTVDLTATAATQVATFVGTVTPAHFTVTAASVTYSGPSEWSYRRFVLHMAALAKAAGGVDTFVIGSEMRGLTWVRSALGVYPFVTALIALAADVKAMLGSDTKVTYAADWTELPAHQTGVPGECFFHLDPLWASSHIDAVGVDGYWPLADWREGADHADWTAGWRSVYDRAYLQSNVAAGEGFDWYYASSGDRIAQTRTPITDGAYGKPWVWRSKDIKSWWSNAHYDRPAGVQSTTATAWQPQSKPIWIMEAGCPALDLGANQPNVFYDPKSSESAVPYFSNGWRDDRMQRAYLEALLAWYTPGQTGYAEANNPISQFDGRRMVDAGRIYAYCWDARNYPAFPRMTDVWGDGDLWQYGHWLTGRLVATPALDPDALPVGLSPELPLADRLLTGTVRVTNLRGFSRHPTVEISQSVPAPLEVRAIRCEVAYG